MIENGGLSPADIKAVLGTDNQSGFGGNGIIELVVVLFFLMIFMNNRRLNPGADGGELTRADLTAGFNFNSIDNELRQIGNGIAQSNYAISNDLRQMQMQQAQCCCDVRTGILENRYASERNTCNIINAVHAENESLKALITQNTMQDLRDRLEQNEREKLAVQFQLSQVSQTSNIVNELRPCAKPAYITCSPYVSNSCGCVCPQF